MSKFLPSQKLHSIYLTGYLLLSSKAAPVFDADLTLVFRLVGGYLPSAYSYALFTSYGIDRATIEQFFVYCFIASLLVGTFVASLADRL